MCPVGRRLFLTYRFANGQDSVMDVDAWAMVVGLGRWCLLGCRILVGHGVSLRSAVAEGDRDGVLSRRGLPRRSS